jgi:hypothetical protein
MKIFHVLAGVFLGIIVASEAAEASGRYVYVVGCDAQLSKIDTFIDQKVSSIDLATKTLGHRIIPEVHGVLDGCLSYQAVYDPMKFRFYTIVPLQADSKADGTKDYRVLGFSIPNVSLEIDIAAGTALSEPPHLELDRARHIRVIPASKWAPRTELNLDGFGPETLQIRNQLLETSGDQDLLRIFSGNQDELVIATVNRQKKSVSYIRELPVTTARNIHLSPGGLAVLAEETESTGALLTKTGRLVLYDASSGRVINRYFDPMIRSLAFLAISPNGRAIYHRNDIYHFVDLGKKFSSLAVSRPFAEGYPGHFFADR